MNTFTTHHLRFAVEVKTPIHLNEHKGSSIRGAFFHALRAKFCYQKGNRSCRGCPLFATCPICFLVATLDPEGSRGVDVPRPYTVEPPLGATTYYEPGEEIQFGLSMFAEALNLFPYVVLAMKELEEGGLGRPTRDRNGRWRRGTFVIKEVVAHNPLSGEEQPVLSEGDNMVSVPDVPVTQEQVLDAVSQVSAERMALTFLTPTRLIDQGRLVHRPRFRVLVQRLLERLSALAAHFSDAPLTLDFKQLIGDAERVELVEDQTRWVELDSYSTRKRGHTPISGFVGRAVFEGEMEPFLPWLTWGQFVHVGKNAVKGDGWYALSPPDGEEMAIDVPDR